MFEQVVEQKTTDMRVLPGISTTVAEESRRQWSVPEKQRRMLTKPVGKKKAGD
jgi:hypothetical protein